MSNGFQYCEGDGDGICIRHSDLCDGIEHCPGATDEKNCPGDNSASNLSNPI